MSNNTMGLNRPDLPKFEVGTPKLWGLRLNDEDLAELTICAKSAKATKTSFVRYLVHTYYQQHVLPGLLEESQRTGVPVCQLLAKEAKNYRPTHARDYYDEKAAAGKKHVTRKPRKGVNKS